LVLGASGSVDTGCDKGDGLLVRFSSALPVLLETPPAETQKKQAPPTLDSPAAKRLTDLKNDTKRPGRSAAKASRLAALLCADVFRSSEALPNEKARLKRDQNQPSSRDSKEASTAYTGFPRREASHRFEK
jgi:hypothetical protein